MLVVIVNMPSAYCPSGVRLSLSFSVGWGESCRHGFVSLFFSFFSEDVLSRLGVVMFLVF